MAQRQQTWTIVEYVDTIHDGPGGEARHPVYYYVMRSKNNTPNPKGQKVFCTYNFAEAIHYVSKRLSVQDGHVR